MALKKRLVLKIIAGKVSSKLYIRRVILAHLKGKRILKRRCIDILDVHERQVTHPGRGWGGGGGGYEKRD